MKIEFTNYYKRDFFEFLAVLDLIKSDNQGVKFHVNEFCTKWDKEYNETVFFRAALERIVSVKNKLTLEKYLLDRVKLFKLDLKDMSTIKAYDLKNLYIYTGIMKYIIENDCSEDASYEIEDELQGSGYEFSDPQRDRLRRKIMNLYSSRESYENIKKELVDFKDLIEEVNNKILNEFRKRSRTSLKYANSKIDSKGIDSNLDIEQNSNQTEEIKKDNSEETIQVEETSESKKNDLVDEARAEIQKKVDKSEDISQKEESPKEVEIKSNEQTTEAESENTRLKSIFDEFYSKVNELLPKESQPQNEDNFQRLKEEYDFIVKEKQTLQEDIKKLKSDIEDLNNRYIELQNTIKSKEEEVDFNVVKSIYNILNDKDDLFLDKIYKAKTENKKLDQADFERITNNMLSNLESFGIRVHPQKNIGESIIVKEADISEYRMSSKVVDEIQKNGSSNVKVKYPKWIYIINKDNKKQIKILDNEMVE